MTENKNYIVFFDVDKTIIQVNSAKVLVKKAREEGLMSLSDFLNAVYLVVLSKIKRKDTLKIIHRMGKWMDGIAVEQFAKMVDEIHYDQIICAIRPEIIEEIRIHRENNAEIAILSSAVEVICLPLAKYLGINQVLCTQLETNDGYFTGNPVGKFCFGTEKLVRLKEFCYSRNYSIPDAYYYGDSIDDLPVLEHVGHPVCVTPDKALLKVARFNAWEIRQW